jgi:hypothetical protein
VRIVADLQVKVGRLSLHRNAEQIVNLHRHNFPQQLRGLA